LFVRYATAALRAEMLADPQAKSVLGAVGSDTGIRPLASQ
jgi:hypothetical protein